jgi:hypothetical protein
MAETYWLTFRLADDATYSTRLDKLTKAVQDVTAGTWWVEPTSFLLFQSASDIDAVAAIVKAAINPAKDIVLIGMPDYKSARIIGASTDPDLFKLMPFTKKA